MSANQGGNKAFEHAHALKDAYIASIHHSLDHGKTGMINDGDQRHYLHKGGKTFIAPGNPEDANPVPGGKPGAKQVNDMPQDLQQQLNDVHEGLFLEQFGGFPGVAQGGSSLYPRSFV